MNLSSWNLLLTKGVIQAVGRSIRVSSIERSKNTRGKKQLSIYLGEENWRPWKIFSMFGMNWRIWIGDLSIMVLNIKKYFFCRQEENLGLDGSAI